MNLLIGITLAVIYIGLLGCMIIFILNKNRDIFNDKS